MRKGIQDNGCITEGEGEPTSDRIIGINLGRDYCAEHEGGIDGLENAFGIPGQPKRRCGIHRQLKGDLVGADVRTVAEVPRGLKFFQNLNGYAYLLFHQFGWDDKDSFTAERLDRLLEARGDTELVTAWSHNEFGIRMKNDALNLGTTVLGQIYEAFTKRDVMMFVGGPDTPFGGSSLCLAIRSRVPKEILEKMRETDEDVLKLEEAVEKIAIQEKLQNAGLRYFALSPCWASSIKSTQDGGIKTEYPVIFWLNPIEQRRYNAGWFTVEQLLEWIDGKGPIPKAQVA